MPSDALSPAERTLRARAAAYTLHSQVDSAVHMEAARAASPGQLPYWEREVDPDDELPTQERMRRAKAARNAHMARLALRSSQARRARKKAT
jgi:hypothetical protein